ncbi:unnamed protein product [Caenorhabditis sp. 36 PRJEB53466]|nr:unnamed protein product [Caenorhabditis sp. 36 PRJEB53466]
MFISLTHGKSPDCRQANANLKERLEDYNFGAFLIEKACSRCPNNECNSSFIFILQKQEYFRLKHHVKFDVRPTFLVHTSFNQLVALDHKLRDAQLGRNSVGIQAVPEMINAYVDAIPPTLNIQCQTDFKVGKKDTNSQTNIVILVDAESQVELKPVDVDTQTTFTPDRDAGLEVSPTVPEVQESTTSPMIRSVEVQQENSDDDIVFIEVRPRDCNGPPLKEVKVEPIAVEAEKDVEKETEREIKEETIEEQSEQNIHSEPSHSLVETLSNVLSFTGLTTPTVPVKRGSITQTPAKRIRLANVDICQKCMDLKDYASLEDYCRHVLTHVSDRIHRFKCNICMDKFVNSRSANYHLQMHHSGQSGGETPSAADSISKEISVEHLVAFKRTANQCWPEIFQNVSIEKLATIIKKFQ